MKKLYCFDFDGTITKRDTMFLFLKFYNRSRYRWQIFRYLPVFILLKLDLIKAEKVKKSFIYSIIKDDTQENIEASAQSFFTTYYPKIIRPDALEFIERIDHNNIDCYLVTASLDMWVKPFAKKFDMKLIATKAEFKEGKYTGNFESPNCNGKEKVRRIEEELGDKCYDKIIAYGDSLGDKPMLEWADKGYYEYFH